MEIGNQHHDDDDDDFADDNVDDDDVGGDDDDDDDDGGGDEDDCYNLQVEPHFLPSATSTVLVIGHQCLCTVEAA